MDFNFKHKDQKLHQAVNYAPGKRHLSKIYWYLLLILILTPFVYLGTKIFTDTFLMSATGHISFGEVTIRSPGSAYIQKILLLPGESFVKGQDLIDLTNPQLLAQLQSLNDEIKTLTEQKMKLLNDNTELGHLLEAKETATKYIVDCKEYLAVLAKLREKGLTTIMDISKARSDLNNALQQYKTIEGNIAKLNLSKDLQREEFFDKSIRETEGKIKQINTSLALLSIKAPEEGNMAKLLVEENEYVKDGQDIAKIVLKRNIFVIAYIESKFISEKLKTGMQVRILFPDGIKIKGTVSSAPVLAESDPSKSGLVQSDKNKIVVRIIPQEEIPHQYKIAGLPVDILFY
ncbi:MAG: HlyD family efflux transporter periplasmic adaptor subunit [Lentisphaerota bacterium]